MSIAGLTEGDRELFKTLAEEREAKKAAELERLKAEAAAEAKAEAAAERQSLLESIRTEKSGKSKNFVSGQSGGGSLRYPRDLFTSTTDYLQFDFYEFGPYLANPSGNGIQGPKIGTVQTYMPNNVSTGYAQSWGEAKISPTGRVLMNAISQAAQGADRKTVSEYLNDNLLAGTAKTTSAGMFAKALKNTNSTNLSANSLIGMQEGVGINNVVELFWSGHGGQRTTAVNILMAPKDRQERKEIEKIIKTFKVSMHPSKNSSSAADVGGRFVEYPLAVQMRYMHKSGENHRLNKFKPMVVTNVQTNFTPDNQYVVHDDGAPVAYGLTISLKEIKILYADDISESQGIGF